MRSIMKCKICNRVFKSSRSLAAHVRRGHELTSKEYYDKYLSDSESGVCPVCGKGTDYRGLETGYLIYCSPKCSTTDPERKDERSARRKGRKQSKETIEKRINNTDQVKKEKKRQESFLKKYGVTNPVFVPEIQQKIIETNTGRKNPRKNSDHQRKIIESKRRNGTLKHTDETKRKIKQKLRELWSSEDAPINLSENSNCYKRSKSGHYGGFFYRSSYELTFIKYCIENNIKIVSAETKEFRVRYLKEDKGTYHYYYPDFYLPEYDMLIEVKPLSMLDVNYNMDKILAGMKKFPLSMVTEDELGDLDMFFKYAVKIERNQNG